MSATILVVDDDAALRSVIAAILGDEGYAVALAGDGVDALALLDRLRPACILLDLHMPRMDGYAFAAALVRRGLRPAIPLIIFTAEGQPEEKVAQLHADGALGKPFDVDDLLAVVSRFIQPVPE